MSNSLIDSEINKENFVEFIERLKTHNRGKGVEYHCTSNPLFAVQAKRICSGLLPGYGDKLCIYDHENYQEWLSLESFIDDLDEDSIEYWELDQHEEDFLEMSKSNQWDCLENIPSLTISGYVEKWEYINSHLTKEAAERFIKRKKHDYRHGMRVYVYSQHYAWEFNSIIDALIDGKIGWLYE